LTTANPAIVKLPFQNGSGVSSFISGSEKIASNQEALILINSLMTQIEKSLT
jgi:hypothetical protein